MAECPTPTDSSASPALPRDPGVFFAHCGFRLGGLASNEDASSVQYIKVSSVPAQKIS